MSTGHRTRLDQSALNDIKQVVAVPLQFKAKLKIGEDAYTSLRAVNKLRELWDVLGAAGTGAAFAKSTVIASTFFAPSGFLGLLGIGTAVTPVGWVAFAALASGGACYGLYRWMGDAKGSRVIEIPIFLNTPLDVLGLALFDLIAPLSLRLAAVDGQVEPNEKNFLIEHLVDEWGLDRNFVLQATRLIEPDALTASLDELATELSGFLHYNPDCNHKAIAVGLIEFFEAMLASGGALSPQEADALDSVRKILQTKPASELSKYWDAVKSQAGKLPVEALKKRVKRLTRHLINPSRFLPYFLN